MSYLVDQLLQNPLDNIAVAAPALCECLVIKDIKHKLLACESSSGLRNELALLAKLAYSHTYSVS